MITNKVTFFYSADYFALAEEAQIAKQIKDLIKKLVFLIFFLFQ